MVTLLYFGLVHDWTLDRSAAGAGDTGSGAAAGLDEASGFDAGSGSANTPRAVYSFALTVLGHGLNSGLAILDLLITRNRLVLRYLVYALLFATAYMAFTVIYYVAGGTNEDGVSPYIYPALDWTRFGANPIMDDCPESIRSTLGDGRCQFLLSTRVVASLLILVGVPCLWFCCFCTYLLRIRMRRGLEAASGSSLGGRAPGGTYVV